jgi:hypothetical protein
MAYLKHMTSVKSVRAKLQTEAQIQKAILTALELKGRMAWRINSGTILGSYRSKSGQQSTWAVKGAPTGTPDIIVHLNDRIPGSRFAFLEVKRPGGKLRPEQREWFAKAERAGVLRELVTSVEEALLQVSLWEAGG